MLVTCGTPGTSNMRLEDRIADRHIFDRILGRRHRLRQLARPLLPRGVAPEVVDPDKAALLEVLPETRGLLLGELNRADVRRHHVRTAEQGVVGEAHEPYVRNVWGQPADFCFREFRESNQEVALTPGIVRAPAGAIRLAPYARVEQMTSRHVGVGQLCRLKFRRVALLAHQARAAEPAAAKLRVRETGGRDEGRDE